MQRLPTTTMKRRMLVTDPSTELESGVRYTFLGHGLGFRV